ncbi:venom prothrombin activator pseutarin-C non-catalytic subunit-like [Diadema setosum]|uniref:venom prothrombin activator pseutarin-C non-catalytic subunit-like n=1 Tax=Diadema setosum TaxID=31175 RepID=UPI003B3B685C
MYNLNYTLPMNRRCPVAEINGMDVQLIPKLTGHQARPGNCGGNAEHGYRVCRRPGPTLPAGPTNATSFMMSTTSSPCSPLDAITGDLTDKGSHEIPTRAKALGMESGAIKDTNITASSWWSAWFPPQKGRLNTQGAWAPKTKNSSWIQVELEHPTCIVGLATQGQWGNNQWVKEYKVGCGLQAGDINIVTEKSPSGVAEKIFSANTDASTVVYNGLPEPHLCRFVQVHSVSWYNYPSMRLELYTGSVNSETWKIPALAKALGMEAHTIPDTSITATSFLSSKFAPEKGRLHAYGGWSPLVNDDNWIKVELEHLTCVVGLATQGISEYYPKMWVKEYKVGCGLADGVVMVTEKSSDGVSEKIFSANTDGHTVVYNGLPEPHLCRFVKVYPVSWFKHVSLRMELYTTSVTLKIGK